MIKYFLFGSDLMKRTEILGTLAAFFANVIFGFSFLFSVITLKFAQPLVILAIRFSVAFIILNILWLLRIIKLDFKNKNAFSLIPMCLAQPLFYFIFEIYGISMTSSAISGVIISLVPVFVMVLSSALLKESANLKQWLFAACSIVGTVLINVFSNDGNENTVLGILILLGAVLCAAIFNLLSRKKSKEFSPIERTYMMFGTAAVGFNIIAAIMYKGNYLPQIINACSNPSFSLSIVYLAVVSSIIAFYIYNYATSKIDLIKAASFSNIIPVVSIIAGVLILGDSFSILQFICSALIILGVWGVNHFGKKE